MNRNWLGKGPCAVTLSALLFAVGALAESPPQARRDGPPPEAIKACSGKKAGDKVQFEGRYRDQVSGTCALRGDVLVAVPEHPHGPGAHTGPSSGSGAGSSMPPPGK